MHRRRWFAYVVTGALTLVAPITTLADAGVAIDLGAIDINQKLSRGGTYQLPTMGVRNPGSEPSDYVMTVGSFQDQRERQPPQAWFAFSPSSFSLGPGETQPVRIELNIPTGARPDDYRALLEARLAVAGEGAAVGAGAGARVSFTVKPSNVLQAWQLQAQTWMADRGPWSYLIPFLMVFALVAWFLMRRFELRVARRRG
ncbi:MAG: hypothetical protein C0506_11250 [Anaerolinea sp.]|nr:hypothetical protein [Anaerolinea sp.]